MGRENLNLDSLACSLNYEISEIQPGPSELCFFFNPGYQHFFETEILLALKVLQVFPVKIANLRTTTTTASELQCTAQARPVNFVVVVSSTTPNKVKHVLLQTTSFGRYKSTVLSDF